MGSWKNSLIEILLAVGCLALISLLGLFVLFSGGNSNSVSGLNSRSAERRGDFVAPSSPNEDLSIGIPATAKLVEALTQASAHGGLSEDPHTNQPPPAWLMEFEALAGTAPLDAGLATKLWAYAESLPETEDRLIAYAMIADRVDLETFQGLIWSKVWDPSTNPDVARTIANVVPMLPEEWMFPYLLALLRHPDEETRAMARGVLWGYFPDVPETEYPRAVQYRNLPR